MPYASLVRCSQPMSSARSLLLVGHSHLQALVTASADQVQRDLALHVINARDSRFNPWAEWVKGCIVINPVLVDSIAATITHTRPDAVAVTVDGSQHFTLGATNHPRRFDFILPGREDLPLEPQAEIVPYGLMRQVFMHEQRNVLRLLAAVRAAATVPVFYLSVPPVVAKFIEAHMPSTWDTMQKLGSPGAALRFKLWALYMDVVRVLCAKMDVTFLPPPTGTMDQDGYLAEALDGDGLHGNARYGAAVLQQLINAMEAGVA